MDQEKANFQLSGLKWLYEMELVGDPQLINNLKLNIFNVSAHITEVELLTSYHHKSMLIYIQLNWFGRNFLTKRVITEVEDRIGQLLPKFRLRVVTDFDIFSQALNNVNSVLKGNSDEDLNSTISVDDTKPSSS